MPLIIAEVLVMSRVTRVIIFAIRTAIALDDRVAAFLTGVDIGSEGASDVVSYTIPLLVIGRILFDFGFYGFAIILVWGSNRHGCLSLPIRLPLQSFR